MEMHERKITLGIKIENSSLDLPYFYCLVPSYHCIVKRP